jgi:hypothetical protein
MYSAALSTTQIVVTVDVIVLVGLARIAVWQSSRKRRTQKLRAQFGRDDYTRAVTEGGSQQKAEAILDARAARVEKLRVPPLEPNQLGDSRSV